MKLITAVNRILPKLGEHPVTNLEDKHPTLGILLPAVDTKIDDLTIDGLWFNTATVKYYPDANENFIFVPPDVLSFIPDIGPAVLRNGRLYNSEAQNFIWTEPVSGRIVTRVAFDDLPETAASLVWYSVLVDTYVTDIGLTDDVKIWQMEAGKAQARMETEHLRQMRYSTTRSGRYGKLRAAMRG